MNIVLTGYKGFIGSHYYDLIKQDHDVSAYDLVDNQDLCDKNLTKMLPDCDVLVHMAATNGTRLFYETPTIVSFNNSIPTFNLVERYMNTKTKFVFTSTCEIFNGAVDSGIYNIPTDENVPVMFSDILNPRWSYSLPKALGENLVANCGLNWLIIRYFNVYGPKQKDHFIQEFVKRVSEGEYYIKGDDTRSFCYVDDAVKMTHDLIMNCNNEIVNVGNQTEVRISEAAKIIMEIMGVDPEKLQVLPGPPGSAKRRCPDTKKLSTFSNIHNVVSLEEGLRRTVESLL